MRRAIFQFNSRDIDRLLDETQRVVGHPVSVQQVLQSLNNTLNLSVIPRVSRGLSQKTNQFRDTYFQQFQGVSKKSYQPPVHKVIDLEGKIDRYISNLVKEDWDYLKNKLDMAMRAMPVKKQLKTWENLDYPRLVEKLKDFEKLLLENKKELEHDREGLGKLKNLYDLVVVHTNKVLAEGKMTDSQKRAIKGYLTKIKTQIGVT